ncbi:MAG: hypothetical protein NC320_12480 [Clostridium sp.]|nr:hypothetical protein [Clostridium sp.]
MQVLGIAEKMGKYEGNEYHNIMIHCCKENENAYGQITEVVKVKFANVREVFGKVMSASDWQRLVGKTIFVSYDRYGVVQNVQAAEE